MSDGSLAFGLGAVGYLRLDGKRVGYADVDSYTLARVEPIYRTVKGWRKDIRAVRQYADLPTNARRYVETVEKFVGMPVKWISVGSERDAVIRR